MRSSCVRLTAELIPMSQKASYPLVPRPGAGTGRIFFETPHPDRVYPTRKRFLYDVYADTIASSRMILAFQYNRLQDSELVAMRKAINELAKKLPEGESPVGFMILRKGVLGAAVAKYPHLANFKHLLAGPMILLHSREPSTSQIPKILSQIDKVTSFKSPTKLPPPTPFTTLTALRSPPPSSSGTAQMVPVNPRMFCVGGVVDGEILGSEGVRTMGGMPGLRTLQAQVLGLVGTPAQQIAGLMGQASGGQLARVLEGLKVSLEEKEGGGEAAKSE